MLCLQWGEPVPLLSVLKWGGGCAPPAPPLFQAIPVTVDTFQNPTTSESLKTTAVTGIVTSTTTIRVTVHTFQAPRESEGRKARTATRIATLTPAMPVTVDTRSIRGCKNDDIYEHRDPDPHDPCDTSHFRDAKRIRGSKSDDRYGAVIATPTPAIPVTVDAFSKSERFTPKMFY